MYSPQLIDHFEHPRHVGELAAPDAAAEVENPACGDVIALQLKIAGGRIAEARYRAKGCVAAIGCGSALAESIIGRTVNEAQSLSREEIVAAVGGLPPASEHASHLAIDALRAAFMNLARK
ncbi:MAG: iron-sulfur cluster assembly scaffold protein [Acidobacteriota bacterium]|nr:iron-sulfur cluster assembly scaffold protein [Acidobacteriota bacterium]